MSAIPRSFIDELLTRTDIVSLINKRVTLNKRGNNYTACCPFHNEKTPSFSVSEPKQFFHCFGCGENGNALSFLMKYNNSGFIDAVETLAEEIGVAVPKNQTNQSHQPDTSLASYSVFEECLQFYRKQLNLCDDALEYAALRGLDDETIDFFQIGYAPNEWRSLTLTANNNPEKYKILISSGLLINSDNNTYDRFRNRLMFPIHNRRGKIIGFAGRVIDRKDNPKYLNSPESPWFQKGKELYGLYHLLQKARNPSYILVTEGYMDVLALSQHGIHQCVASMGTALSKEHLQQLFRITDKVILAFDGDQAGIKAADRSLQNLLSHLKDKNRLEFLILPTDSDPDSLVRQLGTDGFEQLISEQSLSLSKYLISVLNRSTNPKDPDDIPQIFSIAKPIIEVLDTTSSFRTSLVKTLAEHLDLPITEINNHLQNKSKKNHVENIKNNKSAYKLNSQRTLAQDIVLHLLNFPKIANDLSVDWTKLEQTKGISFIKEMVDKIHENPEIKAGNLIEYWRDTAYYNSLCLLMKEKYPLKSLEEASLEAQGSIALMQKKINTEEWQRLHAITLEKGFQALDADQRKRYQELSQKKTLSKA